MKTEIKPQAVGVADFCTLYGISRALFYKLVKSGEGPKTFKAGRRTLISLAAANEWLRRREGGGADVVLDERVVQTQPLARGAVAEGGR